MPIILVSLHIVVVAIKYSNINNDVTGLSERHNGRYDMGELSLVVCCELLYLNINPWCCRLYSLSISIWYLARCCILLCERPAGRDGLKHT